MHITLPNCRIYAYTGAHAWIDGQPTAILIHGVLCDHSVWALQSRYLAHHGWNVLAIDLPGHGRSSGTPPHTVEAAAGCISALINTLGLQQVALIGHSWGSLIALQTAAQLRQRISHLIMVGTAYPMPVSQPLLDSALHTPQQAITMVNNFSRHTLAPPSGAGVWVWGAGVALGQRILGGNTAHNLLHVGLSACNAYKGGEAAIADATAPLTLVLGLHDQMTPPKAAQLLVKTAQTAKKPIQVITLPCGHNHMSEAPDACLQAILTGLRQQDLTPAA